MPPVPGTGDRRAGMHVEAVVLGLELAREIDLGSGDMTMDVDAPRHDHHALRVDAFRRRGNVRDDLSRP